VPVGRWIRARSGGRTRLVQLGRPRAPLALFDLVVTTPQYRVARRPNVLHLMAPVHQADPAALAAAARAWRGRFDHLPRPRIALLAGGDSPPYRLDPMTARRLGEAASAAAGAGSLLVTSSYRMAPAAVDALFDAVSVPAELYRWRANSPENPFFAYLAAADEFIVTGDSVSMLTEATATGKPVRIFDLPRREALWARAVEAVHGRIERRRRVRPDDRPARLFDGLLDLGLFVLPRDFGSFHRWLIAEGRAAWLGDAPPLAPTPVEAGLSEVAARVRQLIAAETADDRGDDQGR
jgi:mitochondrial fission protein ELM1